MIKWCCERTNIKNLIIIRALVDSLHNSIIIISEISIIRLKPGLVPFFKWLKINFINNFSSRCVFISYKTCSCEPIRFENSTSVLCITTIATIIFFGKIKVSFTFTNKMLAGSWDKFVNWSTISIVFSIFSIYSVSFGIGIVIKCTGSSWLQGSICHGFSEGLFECLRPYWCNLRIATNQFY